MACITGALATWLASLGLLYLALAVGIWAATPPPEEGAETLGDGSLYVRAHKDPGVRASLPEGNIDPDTGDSLTAFDHLWLAGLPFVGWILIFLALPKQMAFLDGVFLALLTGTPGEGFTLGVTDISALFGLLLIYPGDTLVLALPITGLVACLVQAARGHPTAFAAFMEYGLLVLILNIIALVAIPWR